MLVSAGPEHVHGINTFRFVVAVAAAAEQLIALPQWNCSSLFH
jgi:hypothetical protein